MANASNSFDLCPQTDSYQKALDIADFITYTVVALIYTLLGTFEQLICLLVFTKQARTSMAYRYQILLSASKIFEVIAFASYSLINKSLPKYNFSTTSFFNGYPMSVFSAQVVAPLRGSATAMCLLVSLAISSDRVHALWKPIAYKEKKSINMPILVFVVCAALAFVGNIGHAFRKKVLFENGRYSILQNWDFVQSWIGVGAIYLHTMLRITATLTMIILNVVILSLYRSMMIKIAPLKSGVKNVKEESEKKSKEKTLTILAVVQSLAAIAAVLPTDTILIASIYSVEAACYNSLYITLGDLCSEIAQFAYFAVLLLVCKRFRKMVSDVVHFWR